jgi:hypothetical protein
VLSEDEKNEENGSQFAVATLAMRRRTNVSNKVVSLHP